jgi:hypothetical protein
MNMNKVKTLLILVVILIVVYILYLYIKRLSKKAYELVTEDKLFYNQPSNAMLMKKIDVSDIPRAINDTSYSMGLWFFIEDWKYRFQQVKHILNKGDAVSNQPAIYLDRTKNILKIKVDVEDSLHEVIEIPDIYLRQWVHIYLNVEDKNVNVYLNGHLVKSHILQSTIVNNKSDIYVNKSGGFGGYVTKLILSNGIKNQNDIEKIYKRGPYSSSLLDIFGLFFKSIFGKIAKLIDACNT